MTEKITSNQENRIVDVVRDAVRALCLSKDEAQEIIMNGGMMQEEVKPILRKLAIADKRFGQAIKKFKFTVPVNYNHNTQIDTFAQKTKKLETTGDYDDHLTSANFAKATNKLEPGKTYKVKIFPILSTVTSEDCLKFLRKQNVLLVGGQGLTLIQALKADQFPTGKWTVSFDEKNALWEDAFGDHRVPISCPRLDGCWDFGLGRFEGHWVNYYCLLCVCDL